MAILRDLAQHGIRTNAYRELAGALRISGIILPKQMSRWEIAPDIKEIPIPKELSPGVLKQIEESIGQPAWPHDIRVPGSRGAAPQSAGRG